MRIHGWTTVAAVALTLLTKNICFGQDPQGNLLTDGGFEGELNSAWRTYTPRTGPLISTTQSQAVVGHQCLSVSAPTDLIGLVVTEPMLEVAPGERFSLSIAARSEGVRSDTGGSLAFGAAFVNARGAMVSWDRVNPSASNDGKWQRLAHDVRVPDGATQMMFQVGLRRARGQSWWDDGSLISSASVALRIDAPPNGIAFGETTLPAVLLNRYLTAGTELEVLTQPGAHCTTVKIDHSTTQAVALPFTFNTRGSIEVKSQIFKSHGSDELFNTTQTVSISDAITVEPLIPTHWVTEDPGKPRFDAELKVNVHPSVLKPNTTVVCTVRDAEGKVVTVSKALRAENGPITIAVDCPTTVIVGDYTATFEMKLGDKILHSIEEPWHIIHRSQAQTTVSADGYPIVEGKKVFPLALYMGDPARFTEMHEAGFNITQSYPAFAGPGSSNRTANKFLDQAHAAGLKTLTFITHGPERLPDAEALKRIRTFRNHPATLVWYQEEVLARGYKSMSYVENLVGMLHREAPHFPVLQGDQRDESSRMIGRKRWFPDEHMDFGTWWWYPTPLRETASMENYEGDPSGPEKEYKPPKFLTDNGTTKPIWMAVQCYAKPGQSDARFPTPEEYRCHAYLSICHGAKGLLYYTGLGEGGTGVLSRPDEGHWQYLKKLAGELREMSPVIMSADAAQQPELVTSGALVSARLKQSDGVMVMLTVNRSIVPVTAEWRVPSLSPAAEVKVRYEDRTLKLRGGNISDKFDPYAVHIYEWH